MADDAELPPLTGELTQAMMLLRASHDFYQAMLDALRQNTDEVGDPDLPGLFKQMNQALTGFAPRDFEINRLLDRLQG